jgi:hypothetical protein
VNLLEFLNVEGEGLMGPRLEGEGEMENVEWSVVV